MAQLRVDGFRLRRDSWEEQRMSRARKEAWDDPSPSYVLEALEPLKTPTLEGEQRAELLATIHQEIVPQLLMAHRASSEVSDCVDSRPPPSEEEVAAFAVIVAAPDLVSAVHFVEKLAREGLSLETLLMNLVAPAARLLGEQWLSDARSFSEVTIGLSTLQQLLNILGPSFAPGLPDRGLVVLLSPLAEQHTLGIFVLGEFLRRAGWGVRVAPSLSETELVDMVGAEPVVMVGISVSCTAVLKTLGRLIQGVKRASLTSDLAVFVGGPHPDLPKLAPKLGAIFCADARDAVRQLDQRVGSGK